MIQQLAAEGVTLVTVLDKDYPTNLRLVYDRPPFLFVRGELRRGDERAVAVVGTRTASQEGQTQADRLARELAASGVTVLSGLALGIDAAAHEGTLSAGGRTVAVLGTGIRRVYPAVHADLADRIVAEGGALVSQFWPDSPPARWSFPMRNRTMSGMAIGTVVVEASKTSGAKMQARLALAHGKRVFLVESLVCRSLGHRTTPIAEAPSLFRALTMCLRRLNRNCVLSLSSRLRRAPGDMARVEDYTDHDHERIARPQHVVTHVWIESPYMCTTRTCLSV
jgi:DNA protecting protein DprA